MAKNIQEFEGIVEECLPNARFLVQLDNNGPKIHTYAAGSILKNHIRIVEGDRVVVEVSPYDVRQGRIKFRKK